MNDDKVRKAINLALKCQWDEAIKINKLILKEDKENIEALNRLARAYLETNEIKKANNISKKVLKIEPSNKIAEKSIEKCKDKVSIKNKSRNNNDQNIDASVFLEETGKTKLTNLINLGATKNISKLYSGDEVKLLTHSHRVTVTSFDNCYIGRLPDDLSAHIKSLIKAGNTYKVFIKSILPKCVTIFIKEIKKAKGLENTMSFPIEKSESLSKSFSQSDF